MPGPFKYHFLMKQWKRFQGEVILFRLPRTSHLADLEDHSKNLHRRLDHLPHLRLHAIPRNPPATNPLYAAAIR